MIAMLTELLTPALESAKPIGLAWLGLKGLAKSALPVGDDAIHAIAGPVLQVFFALALRTNIARSGPWLLVALLEILNEASDLALGWTPAYEERPNFAEAIKDFGLTMCLPSILLVLARLQPAVFVKDGDS